MMNFKKEACLKDVWVATYAAAFTRYRHYEMRGQIYTTNIKPAQCSKMAIDEANIAVQGLQDEKNEN